MAGRLMAASRPSAWAFSSKGDAKKPLSKLTFRLASSFTSRRLEWIWEGLIARGKLTLLSGEEGVGKSLFALQVAAMVTRGWTRPVQAVAAELRQGALESRRDAKTASSTGGPGGGDPLVPGPDSGGAVIYFSAFDSVEDTLAPRLQAAGADLNRVAFFCRENTAPRKAAAQHDVNDSVQAESVVRAPVLGAAESRDRKARAFDLEADLPVLKRHLKACRDDAVDVKLIVIDPIDGFLQGARNPAERADVIAQLTELAESSNVAILVIGTFNVTPAGMTGFRQRTLGHELLAQAARSVVMIVRDLEDESRRLVLPTKLTLGPPAVGLAFTLVGDHVDWHLVPVDLSGPQYYAQAKDKLKNPLVREECNEITRVTRWLEQRLAAGRVASTVVRTDAVDAEIAYSTLRRAFRSLCCRTEKEWGTGRWYWRLPGPPNELRSVQSEHVAQGVQHVQGVSGGLQGRHDVATVGKVVVSERHVAHVVQGDQPVQHAPDDELGPIHLSHVLHEGHS